MNGANGRASKAAASTGTATASTAASKTLTRAGLFRAGMFPMSKPRDEDPQIDEKWFREWFAYGMASLDQYMCQSAAFEAYYRRREAEQEGQDDNQAAA